MPTLRDGDGDTYCCRVGRVPRDHKGFKFETPYVEVPSDTP